MMETLVAWLWSNWPAAAGGLALVWLAVWVRRVSAVATYARALALVGALVVVGAVAGVINTGRALELAAAGWRALVGAVGAYGGVPA